MTLNELLRMQPKSADASGLILAGNKTLHQTLAELGITIEEKGAITLKDLRQVIVSQPRAVQRNLMKIEILEGIPIEVSNNSLNQFNQLSPHYATGSLMRERIGVAMSISLMISCLAFTFTICWVAVLKKEFPDTTLILSILFAMMSIAWFYMGLINKERRDVLSVVVGDKMDQGVLSTVAEALLNRKKGKVSE